MQPAQFTGVIGVACFLLIAWALSSDRRRIPVRVVVGGVLLQVVFAATLLWFEPAVWLFDHFARLVTKVISFAGEGSRFIFGKLVDAGPDAPWGFIFAVQVLPVIVFFAALMSVLYHLGAMQRVVAAFAWVFRRTLGVSGVEALVASANIFVGQTEAPLCIRPYLPRLTRSQLMAVMTTGFATIAGSVMAAFIGLLGGDSEESRVLFAKHLMTASLMSAPAALVMAKIMMPETESPVDQTAGQPQPPRETHNIVDAAAAGASDGLKLALNVAAMLVAFVALLALVDWPVRALGEWGPIASWREASDFGPFGIAPMLGVFFTPAAWVMGVPAADTAFVGSLLGKQIIATEFVAYLALAEAVNATPPEVSPRAAQIATYALCGFCNLPSIAIQIGGLAALAPERRSELARIAPRAMLAGALACWSTGAIASVFIPL